MNNGQGFEVAHEDVINNLMTRIASLTMELAVKDAYIAHLESEKKVEVKD